VRDRNSTPEPGLNFDYGRFESGGFARHANLFLFSPRLSLVGLSLFAAGRFFAPCADTLSLLARTLLFFFPSLRSDSWTVSSHTSSIVIGHSFEPVVRVE